MIHDEHVHDERAERRWRAEDRVALCVARFYTEFADPLEEGARDALAEAGITEIDRFEVPGAFELPLIAATPPRAAVTTRSIALGAVIRGETDHYDYVCGETARGIQNVQLHTGVPVGFGVLTVDSAEQARARVKGGTKRDTGGTRSSAALASLAVKRELTERPRRAGFSVWPAIRDAEARARGR